MIPLKLKALITTGGKLVFDDTDLLRGWLAGHADQTIEVTFGPVKHDKTLPQLGYFFGHVIPQIADYTGYTEEEVYGILKKKFCTRNPGTDREYVLGLSDPSFTQQDMSYLIEHSVLFGQSLGADIYPCDRFGG